MTNGSPKMIVDIAAGVTSIMHQLYQPDYLKSISQHFFTNLFDF